VLLVTLTVKMSGWSFLCRHGSGIPIANEGAKIHISIMMGKNTLSAFICAGMT